MMSLKNFLLKRKVSTNRKAIQGALDLHNRGEVRRDGLSLTRVSHHLEIEWRARDIHPWDRASESKQREVLLAEQSSHCSRLSRRIRACKIRRVSSSRMSRRIRILASGFSTEQWSAHVRFRAVEVFQPGRSYGREA